MDWQPIETAPRDGTRVDLFGKWKDGRPLRYMGGLGRKVIRRDPGRRLIDYYWCSTHKCFRSTKNSHFVDSPEEYASDIVVTHWAPLPPPPPAKEQIPPEEK